jgi:hypothetical protein
MNWVLAQIMEVRYEIPYDDDAEFWDPADLTDATAAENQTDEPMTGQQQPNTTSSTAPEESK